VLPKEPGRAMEASVTSMLRHVCLGDTMSRYCACALARPLTLGFIRCFVLAAFKWRYREQSVSCKQLDRAKGMLHPGTGQRTRPAEARSTSEAPG
jgi:hypothetical protein